MVKKSKRGWGWANFSKKIKYNSVFFHSPGIVIFLKNKLIQIISGSDGGPMDRAVASDPRDPLFESQHLQSLIYQW